MNLTSESKSKMHQNKHQNQTTIHVPVLLNDVLQYLDPQSGDSYLDLTAGYGGHAGAVLSRTNSPGTAVLVDRDEEAQKALHSKFANELPTLIWQDFLQTSSELAAAGQHYDMILADLGVSSLHLNQSERGFSIKIDGPLDMRMDSRQPITAASIVNQASVDELETILHEYGEEPKSARIAQLIAANRPFSSTQQLASVVARAWPGHSRIHPATRTFQALRIAVNDELGMLERSLPLWRDLLNPGGRLVIISFHSLEDRIVKQWLQNNAGDRYDADLRLLTKRPITASPIELVSNPRARSAKLRAAVKIKTERKE
jgi:16S rRNA (cytosine1402-N4)-methyltransferase